MILIQTENLQAVKKQCVVGAKKAKPKAAAESKDPQSVAAKKWRQNRAPWIACRTCCSSSGEAFIHAGSIFSVSSKPWQGPFLCSNCRNKKDAMEGKRPSGVRVV